MFGPILHVVRYDPAELEAGAGAAGRAAGYGLTLGVHSRIEAFAEEVRARSRAGNVYVNRSMIGAVVGVQPFGGEGLSGTGPKAGGPHALLRYAVERAVSVNIAAQGGDPALLNLDDLSDYGQGMSRPGDRSASEMPSSSRHRGSAPPVSSEAQACPNAGEVMIP